MFYTFVYMIIIYIYAYTQVFNIMHEYMHLCISHVCIIYTMHTWMDTHMHAYMLYMYMSSRYDAIVFYIMSHHKALDLCEVRMFECTSCYHLQGKKTQPASTFGASGCGLVNCCLDSSSASFPSHTASAISWLSYFRQICARVSHTRAPLLDVVRRSKFFFYP